MLIIILILLCISSVSAEENSTNDVTIESNIQESGTTSSIVKQTNTTLKTSTQNRDTIYVSTKGNDSNDGTKSSPKATIKNAVKSVTSGGTIYLSSGTYNESEITINKNLSIIGDATKTTIINSQKKHTLTTTATATVYIQAFTIQDAKIKGNGGAINNKGTLILKGIKILTSYASSYGGAIYNTGTLTATKTSFSSNKAKYGGAIFNTNTITLNRCTFSNNKANKTGSSIYTKSYTNINECNFTNNKNTTIYITQNNESQNINSSLFDSNNAWIGGALINKASHLIITKSVFEKNTATVSGGAIYSAGSLEVKECTFNSNKAKNGGAILNRNTLILSEDTFNDNMATLKGGALYSKSTDPVKLNIIDSQFKNNNAKNGGALYILNYTSINVRNTIFNSNRASAIYIKTSTPENEVYNSSFTGNIAVYGGAIRNAYTGLNVKKSTFISNYAKYGGALHNLKGNITLQYNHLLLNDGDLYNVGQMNADYNWWGSNNIDKNRKINVKLKNWFYMTINHEYTKLMNNPINTTVSINNLYDGKKVTQVSSKNALPSLNIQIDVKGAGITENYITTDSYYTFKNVFKKEGDVHYVINAPLEVLDDVLNIHAPFESQLFVNSLQAFTTDKIKLRANVTDELNNSITEGVLDLYVDNKKIQSLNASKENVFTIPGQAVGVYDLKVVYSADNYIQSKKNIKLTVNPKSDYSISIVSNPSLFNNERGTLRAIIRNKNKGTINQGLVKFYLDDKYLGSSNTKNNLSSFKKNMTEQAGYHSVKMEYYLNDKFIIAASDYIYINKKDAQVEQNTFISLSGDLISNSEITSSKKDVYFAMDRTTASYNYSPNDMKIMNTIRYNLESNGFNVKTVKNGPGETYETARYMYNNNVRNSICFILCNGVDANVIREYLKGYDNLLTAVRNRGNDIVMGWFYGAGDIYNPDGEYYYWLEKAWDDNYSNWGGISNPRKTAEKDGIKIVYEKYDLKGDAVANSFVKLYGGNVTESVSKDTKISLKTTLYNTNGQKITGGNIVYTLNNKVIKNMSITTNSVKFEYTVPSISGTYNLKATYYSNNKVICSTERYIRVR